MPLPFENLHATLDGIMLNIKSGVYKTNSQKIGRIIFMYGGSSSKDIQFGFEKSLKSLDKNRQYNTACSAGMYFLRSNEIPYSKIPHKSLKNSQNYNGLVLDLALLTEDQLTVLMTVLKSQSLIAFAHKYQYFKSMCQLLEALPVGVPMTPKKTEIFLNWLDRDTNTSNIIVDAVDRGLRRVSWYASTENGSFANRRAYLPETFNLDDLAKWLLVRKTLPTKREADLLLKHSVKTQASPFKDGR